ncbi:phenylalanine--tRNA ligase subunit beta [Candidatus Dependentiae bacterium]|nr:phenylalanine--tRNA ligase subunit beta [Candidatus Dependentiae bacterium]
MKISLAWVFDHIDANWKKQDVSEIFSKFNQITAEIEEVEKITIDLSKLFLARVIDQDKTASLMVSELKKELDLPTRPDSIKDYFFLVFKEGKSFRWATCRDVGLDKDGLLPAFDCSPDEAESSWRNLFETEDVVFDVDNKSLTHRPDMWGHRGFAREIAAFLRLPLRDKKHFVTDLTGETGSGRPQFSIEIKALDACKRFSGLYFSSIKNRPSNIFIASRLIKVGLRPINAIVDLTNYVMLDWSQPVHAYDAKKISKQKLVARMAKGGEKLVLLDGLELELTKQDLVIADAEKILGLAGVMGGLHDSISSSTTSIFFESANFSPVSVRRTAMRHGVRTDSSTRFEKTLDPNQITDAILRFLSLAQEMGLDPEVSGDVICIGEPFQEKTIGVTHSFLERRSGVKFEERDIIEPLSRIGFLVAGEPEVIGDRDDILYTITIPSYRGAKDVESKEDILEEVIRFFGLNNIALQLPELKKKPYDLTPVFRLRKMKQFLVQTVRMTEQLNYIYYDEEFLTEVGLGAPLFDDNLSLANPVSENNVRLVTTLLPNLFKNTKHNCSNEDSMRFFECGRVFRIVGGQAREEKSVAGIVFEKRKPVDFYECKQYIVDLLKLCGVSQVTCKKIDEKGREYPWVMPYQSAELFHENTRIGVIGKIDKIFLNRLGALEESEAFFFELSLDRLLSFPKEDLIYSPISKYQGVTFDLSLMVPLTLAAVELEACLFDSDDLVERVELIDFFDKKDWADKRSVAFRLWVSHPEKTLEKSEIDTVRENALRAATKLGAQLRA